MENHIVFKLNNNINDTFLSNHIFGFMSDIFSDFYPNFDMWFFEKVIPGLRNNNRAILVVLDQERPLQIKGVSILKYARFSNDKSKLCSFYLDKSIAGRGIGSKLMNASKSLLLNEAREIVLTANLQKVSGSNTNFLQFLNRHGFYITDQVSGVYQSNSTECIFKFVNKKNKEINWTNGKFTRITEKDTRI